MFAQKLKLRNNIRFYRRLNELSYDQLAQMVGRSNRGISFIERGRSYPSLELALRLATLFNVPVDELFFEEGKEPEKRLVMMNRA